MTFVSKRKRHGRWEPFSAYAACLYTAYLPWQTRRHSYAREDIFVCLPYLPSGNIEPMQTFAQAHALAVGGCLTSWDNEAQATGLWNSPDIADIDGNNIVVAARGRPKPTFRPSTGFLLILGDLVRHANLLTRKRVFARWVSALRGGSAHMKRITVMLSSLSWGATWATEIGAVGEL